VKRILPFEGERLSMIGVNSFIFIPFGGIERNLEESLRVKTGGPEIGK
jgi:hypothetical protein